MCAIPGCSSSWAIPRKPAPAITRSRTSRDAARAVTPKRDLYRARVYEALKVAGPVHMNPTPFGIVGGYTDEEGAETTKMDQNTYRPRRVELTRDNLVMDSGQVRETHSGRKATVWVVRE